MLYKRLWINMADMDKDKPNYQTRTIRTVDGEAVDPMGYFE